MDKTITAISTSAGQGAIALVRMSGKDAFAIAGQIFDKPFEKDRHMYYGSIIHKGKILDNVLLVKFGAPHSFTGEDMVEISCHGGQYIPCSVLNALIDCGAVPAKNGEFTRRAFLNGKMDLTNAEGMADMINAESEAEVNAGYSLLSGEFRQRIDSAYDRLIDILAQIEAALDYPEEDLIPLDVKILSGEIGGIKDGLEEMCKTFNTGRLIKSGINAVITGAANAGKSSLLNKLLGTDRAIVTDIAGTTTDIIKDTFTHKGVKINITDTAGIRDTGGVIESIGVARAREAIAGADVIIAVADVTTDGLPAEIVSLIEGKKVIKVYNKTDLRDPGQTDGINISALTGKGVDTLKDRIYDAALGSFGGGLIVTNQRHYSALRECVNALTGALTGIAGKSGDIIAVDINAAINSLGEITGRTAGEDLLNAIFSKFCLGK